MTAEELRAIRSKLGLTQKYLADLVGIAANNLAKQERGELGISEPVARLVRLIAAGVDVEAIDHPDTSRRGAAYKPAKSSKPGHSKNKGRGRSR